MSASNRPTCTYSIELDYLHSISNTAALGPVGFDRSIAVSTDRPYFTRAHVITTLYILNLQCIMDTNKNEDGGGCRRYMYIYIWLKIYSHGIRRINHRQVATCTVLAQVCSVRARPSFPF